MCRLGMVRVGNGKSWECVDLLRYELAMGRVGSVSTWYGTSWQWEELGVC